jgi:pyruvate,orthophosphate dikinase
MPQKWVCLDSEMEQAAASAVGRAGVRWLLGCMGAREGELASIGMPVLTSFTVSTEACTAYLEAGGQFPEGMWILGVVAARPRYRQAGPPAVRERLAA